MNPAIRSVQGNLIVLRRPEIVRRSETDAVVQAALVAAIRAQARPEPEVDQYADLRQGVRLVAWIAVAAAVVAVVGGPG